MQLVLVTSGKNNVSTSEYNKAFVLATHKTFFKTGKFLLINVGWQHIWSDPVLSSSSLSSLPVDQFSHPGYLMIQSHSVRLLLMLGLYGAQLGCESFLAKGKESVQTVFKRRF